MREREKWTSSEAQPPETRQNRGLRHYVSSEEICKSLPDLCKSLKEIHISSEEICKSERKICNSSREICKSPEEMGRARRDFPSVLAAL